MSERMIGGSMMTAERTARSVFVGNIPYDTTEEQLKDIFTQAGPVVSMRLVYDRETGKPKGYGFCEYQDAETAQSAMRNLNNYEIHGRPLRVGVAAGDQVKDDVVLPGLENPYGESTEPEKAPEAISRAVASLPPEQMFELMKQMKLCIQNNPNEARHMLLQNPQLAYALLQAQIIMKIVDPQVAMAMLHRQSEQIPPLAAPPSDATNFRGPPTQSSGIPNASLSGGQGFGGAMSATPPTQQQPLMVPGPRGMTSQTMGQSMGGAEFGPRPPLLGPRPMGPSAGMYPDRPVDSHNLLDPTGRPGVRPEWDIGGTRSNEPGPRSGDMGFRSGDPTPRPGLLPGPMRMGGPRPEMVDPRYNMDPRTMDPRRMGPPESSSSTRPGLLRPPGPRQPGMDGKEAGISAQDHEKAALIMQVLQLSDDQIALLPPDQRQSILVLKDQIARSTPR